MTEQEYARELSLARQRAAAPHRRGHLPATKAAEPQRRPPREDYILIADEADDYIVLADEPAVHGIYHGLPLSMRPWEVAKRYRELEHFYLAANHLIARRRRRKKHTSSWGAGCMS